jgi:hypothetical protein
MNGDEESFVEIGVANYYECQNCNHRVHWLDAAHILWLRDGKVRASMGHCLEIVPFMRKEWDGTSWIYVRIKNDS